MKLSSLLAVGVLADYDAEWAAFQAVQGPRNGDVPDAFKQNVDFVRANRNDDFQLSFTGPFAAMTSEEYQQVLGYEKGSLSSLPKVGVHESRMEAPSEIDWTTQGAVTAVKDQGSCGSCWAFSATGSLEGQWEMAGGTLTPLSEQQMVDCSKDNAGCQGGLMQYAFDWAKGTSLASMTSYPYKARDGSCQQTYDEAIPKGGVTGYKEIKDEADLQNAVGTVGPVSVAIEASGMTFQLYSGGVLTGTCGTDLDHGVLAVGYGTLGGKDYWKVKNSWGKSWGTNGYVLIQRGTNKCGIADGPPSYPIVSRAVQV